MTINLDTDTLTKEQFDGLSPRGKGYAVYMCGDREDQPNIPEAWKFQNPKDAADYIKGLADGGLAAIGKKGHGK